MPYPAQTNPRKLGSYIYALKDRLGISQGRLAKLLDIYPGVMSLYANNSPLRPPSPIHTMAIENLYEHPEWDKDLLANLPPEERVVRKGRAGHSNGGRAANPLVITAAEIETFMRRWNLKPGQIAILVNMTLPSVKSWLAEKSNAPQRVADFIRDFAGDIGPARSLWRRNVSTTAVRILLYKLSDMDIHRVGVAISSCFDFHQPSLIRALKDPEMHDEIIEATIASYEAAFLLHKHSSNPLHRQDFWRKRLAAEKLIEPALLAEGWNADYSAPEI